MRGGREEDRRGGPKTVSYVTGNLLYGGGQGELRSSDYSNQRNIRDGEGSDTQPNTYTTSSHTQLRRGNARLVMPFLCGFYYIDSLASLLARV